MILSWASDSCEEPRRLAGTCSMYSNSAMPQLRTAAIYHGRSDRLRRWAYHANVMNTLEAVNNTTVRSTTEFKAMRPPLWILSALADPRVSGRRQGHRVAVATRTPGYLRAAMRDRMSLRKPA